MAGVLDALDVSAVVIDKEARIISCCRRFARLVGRSPEELVGADGWELVPTDDQRPGRYILADVWKTGEPVTLMVRVQRPDGETQCIESHVQPLLGQAEPVALCQIRPALVVTEGDEPFGPEEMASAANYVVDMSKQMARFGRRALLPLTSDLLLAAALVGEEESGLGRVEETPA